MTDKLIMTTEQREKILTALKEVDILLSNLNQPRHWGLEAEIAMLQSLPMADSEPVEYQWQSPFSQGTWRKIGKSEFDLLKESDAVTSGVAKVRALYTSPQAFTPITADDVTDEMHEAFNKTHMPFGPDREIMAAAYNAVIKHRSEAK